MSGGPPRIGLQRTCPASLPEIEAWQALSIGRVSRGEECHVVNDFGSQLASGALVADALVERTDGASTRRFRQFECRSDDAIAATAGNIPQTK